MIYSNRDIQVFTKGLMNIAIGIAIILITIHSLAPLFGGVFLIEAWFFYGSWIVLAFCIKFEARNILNFKSKKTGFIIANIVELLCYVLWLDPVWGITFGTFILAIKTIGYREYLKKQKI